MTLPQSHSRGQQQNASRFRALASARGFTLIELTVVLSIVVILSAVALAQYKNSVVYAREAVLKDDLFKMRDAINQYHADKGQPPRVLDSLVSERYLRSIPIDPFTNATDSWQTIPSEADSNNPTAVLGISDVRSGSDQTALDGTKYSHW